MEKIVNKWKKAQMAVENGVDIGDFVTSKAKVKILKTDEEKNQSRLEIIIHEGKNRQIRRMCETIREKSFSLAQKQNRKS